jgi:hypothetical protein
MKTRIAISVAALAFGVALASAPAFAQAHIGKGLDDGGLVDVPNTPAPKQLYNSVPPAPAHYGKGLNDGVRAGRPHRQVARRRRLG